MPDESEVQLSGKEMAFAEFARVVSSRFGVSLVWSESLDKRLVSIEYNGGSVKELLSGVARRLGVVCEPRGSGYWMGEYNAEDKISFVRKVSRLRPEDAKICVSGVLADRGNCEVFSDGLALVVCRASDLSKVEAVLDALESQRVATWVCQLYLVSASSSAAREMGIDTAALVDVSYTLARASAGPSVDQLKAVASLSALLRATATRSDVNVIAKPLFLVAEGEKGSLISGLTIPIPKKAVSDQGTVTTANFEFVQSGLTSEVSMRSLGSGLTWLTCKVSIGQVTGFVESAPIQSKDEFSTAVAVADSGVYLLGALDRTDVKNTRSGVVDGVLSYGKKESGTNQIQVWARVYRIEGGVK